MNIRNPQSGQTMIETIIAVFILTMALTAGLGLAIYASSNATQTKKQIVGTNLAREGIEILRMMRDSNWLIHDADGGTFGLDPDCGDNGVNEALLTNKPCYPRWMEITAEDGYTSFGLQPSNNWYRLGFPGNNQRDVWSLTSHNNAVYAVCRLRAGNVPGAFTQPGTAGCANNFYPHEFSRKVTISATTTAPYTPRNPKLTVRSYVVWSGKNCPNLANRNPSDNDKRCKIMLEEDLTNWKDYR